MLRGDFTPRISRRNGAKLNFRAHFAGNTIDPSLHQPGRTEDAELLSEADGTPAGRFPTPRSTTSPSSSASPKSIIRSTANTPFSAAIWSATLSSRRATRERLFRLLNASPDDLVNSITLGDTWVMNPTTINTLRLTFNRAAINKPEITIMTAKELGINMTPAADSQTTSGSRSLAHSIAPEIQSFAAAIPTQSHQLADDFSMLRGATSCSSA